MRPFLLHALALATISNAALSDSAFSLDQSASKWEAVAGASNATGIVAVDGYDVTQPFPGKPVTGWTLMLSVKSGIAYKYFEKEETFVGSVLQLSPPDGLFKTNASVSSYAMGTAHPSWALSALTWRFRPNSTTTIKEDSKRLDCTSLVSGSCWQAMKGIALNFTDPDAIKTYMRDCEAEQENMRFEGTAPVPGKGRDLSELLLADKAPPVKSPAAEYDQAIRDIYIVGMVFAGNSTNGKPRSALASDSVSMECLRVDQFHGSSRTRDQEGAATGIRVPSLWIVAAAAIVFIL